MRFRSQFLTPFVIFAGLPAASSGATAPGDTLLASGLPGLVAPDPADFAFNVSGSDGHNYDTPAQSDITATAPGWPSRASQTGT